MFCLKSPLEQTRFFVLFQLMTFDAARKRAAFERVHSISVIGQQRRNEIQMYDLNLIDKS